MVYCVVGVLLCTIGVRNTKTCLMQYFGFISKASSGRCTLVYCGVQCQTVAYSGVQAVMSRRKQARGTNWVEIQV